ncbi:hypothetical protein MHTCC0001_32680 [Flavobacteriaceae bacterium MHTCC 0001]
MDSHIQDLPLEHKFSNSNIPLIDKPAPNYWPYILWGIYGIGILLFSFRFVNNLNKIIKKIKYSPKQDYNNTKLVLLSENIPPHTFFNYIFLNKNDFESKNIDKTVLQHEATHANQRHTIDILFIEVIQIIFWFNPLFVLLKRYIKLNHEFLADQSVLSMGVDISKYQNTLLTFSSNKTYSALVNPIGYSSLKKRFKIMTTQTSITSLFFRSIILMPLLLFSVFGFSQKKTVLKQKGQNGNQHNIIPIKEGEGATEAMIQEYKTFIAEYEKSKRIHHDKLLRAIALYKIMTSEQRTKVKMYPEVKSLKKPHLMKLEQPTQDQLNFWQNSTELKISIDAHSIKNIELKNYKPEDFITYRLVTNYKSRDEAKLKKQTKGYVLYTNDGYKNIILKSSYNNYHRLYVRYLNEIKNYNKGNNDYDTSELLILKTQLDHIYANFSEKEIEAYKPRKAPLLSTQIYLNKLKEKKSSKVFIEYNYLAKKYNNPNPKGQTYPTNEIKRLYFLYNSLNEDEKLIAEIFPNLPYPVLKTYKNSKHGKNPNKTTSKQKKDRVPEAIINWITELEESNAIFLYNHKEIDKNYALKLLNKIHFESHYSVSIKSPNGITKVIINDKKQTT